MKNIDKEYENLSTSGAKWSVESRLAAYRKEIEAQAQAEINTKVFSTSIKALCQIICNLKVDILSCKM